jgi:SWI/SNF-related matrix-associated actin-dependent regulator of chromatin subfamily D
LVLHFYLILIVQVKRPGNMDVKCTILLLLDHQPMKFKLHPRLAKLLGIPVETRPKIVEALWQYIKTHKLQVNFQNFYLFT